jgi:hypothetical protein
MQEMSFRISQACKAMNKRGTQDVYEACERGFSVMAKELNFEEAGRNITQDQLDTYVCTKNFCEEQTNLAASFISNHMDDLFNKNQPAEDYIDKVFTDSNFLQSVAADAREQEKEKAVKEI